MRTASLKTTPACTRSVVWLIADSRTSRFDVPFARAVGLKVLFANWSSPQDSLAAPALCFPEKGEGRVELEGGFLQSARECPVERRNYSWYSGQKKCAEDRKCVDDRAICHAAEQSQLDHICDRSPHIRQLRVAPPGKPSANQLALRAANLELIWQRRCHLCETGQCDRETVSSIQMILIIRISATSASIHMC